MPLNDMQVRSAKSMALYTNIVRLQLRTYLYYAYLAWRTMGIKVLSA
ncbi:hypothetical protein PBNK5_35380 [Pectobacterium brasiliense]